MVKFTKEQIISSLAEIENTQTLEDAFEKTRILSLRIQGKKITKNSKTKDNSKPSGISGISKPKQTTPRLAAFANWGEDELKSRGDATRAICGYVSANSLQDTKNKRLINVDKVLAALLEIDEDTPQISYLEIQKYLKHLFYNPDTEKIYTLDEKMSKFLNMDIDSKYSWIEIEKAILDYLTENNLINDKKVLISPEIFQLLGKCVRENSYLMTVSLLKHFKKQLIV